ncbi:unnamed protein product, partial [Strongylus vulgaris]
MEGAVTTGKEKEKDVGWITPENNPAIGSKASPIFGDKGGWIRAAGSGPARDIRYRRWRCPSAESWTIFAASEVFVAFCQKYMPSTLVV